QRGIGLTGRRHELAEVTKFGGDETGGEVEVLRSGVGQVSKQCAAQGGDPTASHGGARGVPLGAVGKGMEGTPGGGPEIQEVDGLAQAVGVRSLDDEAVGPKPGGLGELLVTGVSGVNDEPCRWANRLELGDQVETE